MRNNGAVQKQHCSQGISRGLRCTRSAVPAVYKYPTVPSHLHRPPHLTTVFSHYSSRLHNLKMASNETSYTSSAANHCPLKCAIVICPSTGVDEDVITNLASVLKQKDIPCLTIGSKSTSLMLADAEAAYAEFCAEHVSDDTVTLIFGSGGVIDRQSVHAMQGTLGSNKFDVKTGSLIRAFLKYKRPGEHVGFGIASCLSGTLLEESTCPASRCHHGIMCFASCDSLMEVYDADSALEQLATDITASGDPSGLYPLNLYDRYVEFGEGDMLPTIRTPQSKGSVQPLDVVQDRYEKGISETEKSIVEEKFSSRDRPDQISYGLSQLKSGSERNQAIGFDRQYKYANFLRLLQEQKEGQGEGKDESG